MADPHRLDGLFPALLKHWRRHRGLSQMDLALAADVSARHVSFLETGRSRPSPEMVVCLSAALGLTLRHTDEMLRAAGHRPRFGETPVLPPEVLDALSLMKHHHEPFPLIVVDRTYDVRDVNAGAAALLGMLLAGASGGPEPADRPLNLARLAFDPDGAHPLLVNFDEVGPQLLWRIQREVLDDPHDTELQALLAELLALPTVADDWRRADLSMPSAPALVLHLRAGELDLRFLTTITAFQAPQNVAVENLRIESWYPYDAATAETCARMGDGDDTDA